MGDATIYDRNCLEWAALDQLLQGNSRTFAIAIPLLEQERRRQIAIAYLLFRIADSIEDAVGTSVNEKLSRLKNFRDSLATTEVELRSLAGLWPADSPTEQLMLSAPQVLQSMRNMPEQYVVATTISLCSTIDGMCHFLQSRNESQLQFRIYSVAELRLYCYVVAGIVGELLTSIFTCHFPVSPHIHRQLRQQAAGFGEFLQLTNILKDASIDSNDGRTFIPTGTSWQSVFELTHESRQTAKEYLATLKEHRFPSDVQMFCQFIYRLADATLDRLSNHGPGAKVARNEVQQLLQEVQFMREGW